MKRLLVVIVLLYIAARPAAAQQAAQPTPEQIALAAFNEYVKTKIDTLNRGGSYDEDRVGHGLSDQIDLDVVYEGTSILSRKDSRVGSYCAGLLLQVFEGAYFAGLQKLKPGATDIHKTKWLAGLSLSDFHDFQRLWFAQESGYTSGGGTFANAASNNNGYRQGCALALHRAGIADAPLQVDNNAASIAKLENFKLFERTSNAGIEKAIDAANFQPVFAHIIWRKRDGTESGHSAVLLGYERLENGKKLKFWYWSAHLMNVPKTDFNGQIARDPGVGISYRYLSLGNEPAGIGEIIEMYLTRVKLISDQKPKQ